jgi:membrane protease YdiL (CAAX protease family)
VLDRDAARTWDSASGAAASPHDETSDDPAEFAPVGAPIFGGMGDAETALPRRPPTVHERLVSAAQVAVCSGLPTQLLVAVLLGVAGVDVLTGAGRLSLQYVVWLSLIDTVLVLLLISAFVRGRGEDPRAIFVGRRRFAPEALLGLLLVPIAFLIVLGAVASIDQVAPWLRNPEGNPLGDLLQTVVDSIIFSIVAMLAGGVREEVQRAFILDRFERHLGGAAIGLLIFSVVFGLGHALQGWDAAVLTGLLGLFWGLVYLWRRSIVAPIVCHAAFNLIEVLYHGLQV